MNIEQLESCKEKILQLKEKQGKKIVLPGKQKILLTTTIFDSNMKSDEKKDYCLNENALNTSYLDALIKYLNKEKLIHGIISYVPIKEKSFDNLYNINISRYYRDKSISDYIKENEIDLFIHLKYGDYDYQNEVFIREGMSSFSFMGCSGISLILKEMYDKENIKFDIGFGGTISKGEFLENFHFTDDTINYCSKYELEPLRYKKLQRDEIWPRTLELTFKNHLDKQLNIESYQILENFIDLVSKELDKNDIYDVFGPMKVKK